jgi:hypothetical protein
LRKWSVWSLEHGDKSPIAETDLREGGIVAAEPDQDNALPLPIADVLARVEAVAERHETAKVYQIEFWPEQHMGVPNEIARSALFAAIKEPKTRKLFDNAPIASQGGFSITYTGQQLDQGHIDIFEGIMHFARRVHEGNRVRLTRYALLKLIGRASGKEQYDWLLHRFNHLTATSVSIMQNSKRIFWGSLLPCGAMDSETGEIVVQISRDLAKLFARGLSRVEWAERRKIGRHPLAQWLHLYYAGHAKPLPVSVAWLQKHSGSDTAILRKFRQSLRKALQKLQDVEAIVAWHIDPKTDLVHVKRNPTSSQAKHLTNLGE